MNSELEMCLTKAIYACKVRDMLTKFGIPKNAEVTLEMLFGKETKPRAICPIPTSPTKENVEFGSLSMKGLRSCLMEDFMDPAIYNYGLGEFLPEVEGGIVNDDNKVTVKLTSNTSEYGLNFATIMACCGRCTWGWCRVC